jgi:DNA-binding transcriptional MerR regulator
MARISLEFLSECETERLVEIRLTAGGEKGYSPADIRRLNRIRRLCEDLELNLPAVEVVLNLRQQVLDLHTHMAELERLMREREQELLQEIRQLRRLAAEADWR